MGKDSDKPGVKLPAENNPKPKPNPALISYIGKEAPRDNVEKRNKQKSLNKSLKRFHSIFNIDVCQGDVNSRGADIGMAQDPPQRFNVFGLFIELCCVRMPQGMR